MWVWMFHQYLNQPRAALYAWLLPEGTVNKASDIVGGLHVRFKKLWLFITVADTLVILRLI
jgi:hypothetical protein